MTPAPVVEQSAPRWRQPHAWYDTAGRGDAALTSILNRIGTSRFDGVMLYPSNVETLNPAIPPRLRRILQIDTLAQLDEALRAGSLPLRSSSGNGNGKGTGGGSSNGGGSHDGAWIVASRSSDVLEAARSRAVPCCLRASVASSSDLSDAISRGLHYPWLLLSFKDVTNIPLELAIATLQDSGTTLIKEIVDPGNAGDAVVSLGVMEKGADGVMFSPMTHEPLDRFLEWLEHASLGRIAISVATVRRTVPVGMGHRSCVDLITLFTPKEGMLVGSTSHGGLLCCPEVFPMPYMDLRPFRVNAGAIHSYVYGPDGRTNYLSELRAGSPAMVVGVDGTARPSTIGRIKTEVRPLRLVEVEYDEGTRVNLFLQDDWHVRIFSDQGLPICLSDLKVGDRVLGHVASPGRHVGIKITETIVER